jgi:hypothetical protein
MGAIYAHDTKVEMNKLSKASDVAVALNDAMQVAISHGNNVLRAQVINFHTAKIMEAVEKGEIDAKEALDAIYPIYPFNGYINPLVTALSGEDHSEAVSLLKGYIASQADAHSGASTPPVTPPVTPSVTPPVTPSVTPPVTPYVAQVLKGTLDELVDMLEKIVDSRDSLNSTKEILHADVNANQTAVGKAMLEVIGDSSIEITHQYIDLCK